ncbi:hypothetical protein CKA32_005341 [Geitlerinema sp. FC II]|nr:hypothetical protein CKA32_005341 [Geitlerinema sp. FC II]
MLFKRSNWRHHHTSNSLQTPVRPSNLGDLNVKHRSRLKKINFFEETS